MDVVGEVSRVRGLSDRQLLAGLSGALGSTRKWIALLVVHLGEVEQRRLHLLAGHASMFAYCTDRLGMSEDEAYRRIEVARLARRFSVLLECLGSGRISLSVAVLVKAHLTEINHAALLDAVSGKTVKQAREVLAAWFPRPDALPSIRKLPGRSGPARSAGDGRAGLNAPLFDAVAADARHEGAITASPPVDAGCTGAVASSQPASGCASPSFGSMAASATPETMTSDRTWCVAPDSNGSSARVVPGPREPGRADEPVARGDAPSVAPDPPSEENDGAARPAFAGQPAPLAGAAVPSRVNRSSLEVEPLSPERYKVVFTADAGFKRKLDLARDLLRHAVPHGDLVAIIGRALDLLVEQTLRRRFAQTKPRRARSAARAADPASASCPATSPAAPPERTASAPVASCPIASQPTASCPIASQPTELQPTASCPIASQPTELQPTASQPTASQPTASQPIASQPIALQPTASQPIDSRAVSPATGADASSPEPSADTVVVAENVGELISNAAESGACVTVRRASASHVADHPLPTPSKAASAVSASAAISQAVPAASGADGAIRPAASSPEPSADESVGAESFGDRLSSAVESDACFAWRGPAPSHEADAPLRAPSVTAPSVPPSAAASPALRHQRSRHLPNAARRAVLERDGLRCTWVGPDGARCESRAWLEHDHIMPRGLGGDDNPANVRIRCRAHNRLAAEQVYGQATIARIIARRRARKEARMSRT